MENCTTLSFENHIKNFIKAAKQYSYRQNESEVVCSLQILGQPSNQFIFDPKIPLMQEFYINLYALMNNTNDESHLMWAAINVLQFIIKQGFFYKSNLNDYKFSLILKKLLKDKLSMDKRIKILKLLLEFTYGVKLQWQDSSLTELIKILVKWISTEDKDQGKELISYSLGVLVNVCCKNKFAMFTLVKYTHSKSFLRLLLKLQSDHIFIKVQVYKLLLLLEHVSGQIPEVDVNSLIDVTFNVLEEGLKTNNTFVLRHAVDFFIDISEHSHWKNSVNNYSNYQLKLINLLEVMNNDGLIEKFQINRDISCESIGLVLKFIHHIIQLKNEDLIMLYPEIIKQVLRWSELLDLHQPALTVLLTIVISVRTHSHSMDQNFETIIHSKLEECLNVLLDFIIKPSNFEGTSNMCTWNRYASCFQLLREMIKLKSFCEKLEEKLSFSSLESLFHTLILIDIKDLTNLQNIAFVYIEALCFLSDLMAKNSKWMSLYSEVLNQKHVYNVLAYIIYNGPKNMKHKVLDLVTKFSQQSTLMLSDCLGEIEQLSSTKVKNITESCSIDAKTEPSCTFVQEEQLQMFIDKLETMYNSNELQNMKMSNVIRLYQYKINALQQTEVWLEKSLDNATEEITQKNYKINCLNNESMQLNQMLLENHQEIDELTMEISELKNKLNDINEQFSVTSDKFAKLSMNYDSKCKIIQERDSYIKNLEIKFKELQEESNKIKSDLIDQLKTEKSENKMQVSKLEQELVDKQRTINEKTEEIDSKTSFIRYLENCILEKDKDIADLRKQIEEQQRVREMISQMLANSSTKP